jgi:hypothetical protein
MNAAIPAQRHLRSSNGAGRNRATWLAVDGNAARKRPSVIRGYRVEKIALPRFANEVDEVQPSSIVRRHLRLDSPFRQAMNINALRRTRDQANWKPGDCGATRQNCASARHV